ncbi:adenylate/guanylate cyclase domain-containing protein, partial [Rhizobium leguminosarum]
DGLTDDVTTALARNPELQFIARDSTYAVRGQETDVRKLAAKLGFDYVFEGSARREGDQLRVSARPLRVGDSVRIVSEPD